MRLALRNQLLTLATALSLSASALAADADFGEPTLVPTRAGQLAVYSVGQGSRTLLFWPSLFADHTQYRAQAQALKGEYRMLFVDGPGHGRSSAQPHGSTVATHAQAALDVLDRLKVARTAVVGTSWGGLIGVHMLHQQPERIQGLVAISSTFDGPPPGLKFSERFTVWGTRLMGHTDTFIDGVASSFFSTATLGQSLAGVAEFKAALTKSDTQALAAVVRTVMLKRDSVVPWLAEIKAPTVIVASGADPNLSVATARSYAEQIPQARLVELPSVGHIASIERPGAINDIIRSLGATPPP